MKPGKCDISGCFSSEILLHAPDIIFNYLAEIFRSFLIHGTITKPLLACAFIPHVKSLKDPSKVDSYRAIAASSLILKLFDYVILILWGHLLSTDRLQFGFKKGMSTIQCTWLVTEVINQYLKEGNPVLITLLDCTKAFDLCQFSTLFSKLLKKNIPKIVIRALTYVYTKQEAWVKWGNTCSETFSISNGTRQGSVLSPAIFSVYIDDLIKDLRKLGLGCRIGGVWMAAVGYADDILLMAPNRLGMEKMLEICEKYADF